MVWHTHRSEFHSGTKLNEAAMSWMRPIVVDEADQRKLKLNQIGFEVKIVYA